jgi:hypothetical protein
MGVVLNLIAALIPWRWFICGSVFVLGLGCEEFRIGLLRHEFTELGAVLQRERTDAAEARAAAEKTAREASDKYRATEAHYIKQLEESRNARLHDEMVNNRAIAQFTAERSRLLSFIRAYAGGGNPADDTLAAARDRADTLGSLLAEALRVQEELAGDAERESADARSLLAAWPAPEDATLK